MKRNNQRVMIHGSNFKFFNFSFNGINLKNLLNTVTFYRKSSPFFSCFFYLYSFYLFCNLLAPLLHLLHPTPKNFVLLQDY